ncbi:MAG: DUF4157 domain-containing protein [Pseudomonadota bacterium]
MNADASTTPQAAQTAPKVQLTPDDAPADASLRDPLADSLEDPLSTHPIQASSSVAMAPPMQPSSGDGPGGRGSSSDVHAVAAGGVKGGGSALPHLDKIQASFGGHDLSGVRAHTGKAAQGANAAIGSRAFATGEDVAFGAGSTDLHTAAHEAAHVVQQRAGVQLKGGLGQAGDRYERQADAVADRVVAGEPAADLLGPTAGGGGSTALQGKALQLEDGLTTKEQQEKTKTEGNVKTLKQDLGTAKKLDGGFTAKAGAIVDSLVPLAGEQAKLQLNVNIPVATGVKVGFEFVIEAERSDGDHTRLRFQIGGTVTAEADLWIAKAYLQAKIYGYMEAQGKDGKACFDLMALAIYSKVHSVSEKAADYLFNKDGIMKTVDAMRDDGNDYVETGIGAEISAGIGTKSGSASVDAKAGASTGTKLTKKKGTKDKGLKALASQRVSKTTVEISFTLGKFTFVGSLTANFAGESLKAQAWKDSTIQVAADVKLNASEMSQQLVTAHMLSDLAGKVRGVIGEKDFHKGRAQAAAVDTLAGISGGKFALESGTDKAIKALNKDFPGVKLGWKVSVGVGWNDEGQHKVEIKLDKLTTFEVGEDSKSLVYVLVENIQNLFKLKLGSMD